MASRARRRRSREELCVLCNAEPSGSREHALGWGLVDQFRAEEKRVFRSYVGELKSTQFDLVVFMHRPFCDTCNQRLGRLNKPGLPLMKRLTKGDPLTLTLMDQRKVAGWFLRTSLSMDFAVQRCA